MLWHSICEMKTQILVGFHAGWHQHDSYSSFTADKLYSLKHKHSVADDMSSSFLSSQVGLSDSMECCLIAEIL